MTLIENHTKYVVEKLFRDPFLKEQIEHSFCFMKS